MTEAVINAQTVDVEIVEADGSSGTSLTEVERALIEALDDYLRKNAAFAAAYPGAQLTRVDSNRMLEDTDEGRVYLRYHYQGGDTELWGHKAEESALDLERGIVAVELERRGP